jgi:hypothetical protein
VTGLSSHICLNSGGIWAASTSKGHAMGDATDKTNFSALLQHHPEPKTGRSASPPCSTSLYGHLVYHVSTPQYVSPSDMLEAKSTETHGRCTTAQVTFALPRTTQAPLVSDHHPASPSNPKRLQGAYVSVITSSVRRPEAELITSGRWSRPNPSSGLTPLHHPEVSSIRSPLASYALMHGRVHLA